MLPNPDSLVGTWRRFGLVGPVYEIIASGSGLPDGDRLMRVRVLDTGEQAVGCNAGLALHHFRR